MRAAITADMIKLSTDETVNTMFDEAVKKSVEDGVVVGSVLKKELEAQGFQVVSKPGDKHGVWVDIMKDLNTEEGAEPNVGMVAHAFAATETEAVKQAVFAEMRQAAKEVADAKEAAEKQASEPLKAVE